MQIRCDDDTRYESTSDEFLQEGEIFDIKKVESIDFDCLTIEFNDYGAHPALRTQGNFTDVLLFLGECDEQGNRAGTRAGNCRMQK